MHGPSKKGILINGKNLLFILSPEGGSEMDFKFQTELGAVTVDDSVVTRVAGYAALDCYGIVGMASPI